MARVTVAAPSPVTGPGMHTLRWQYVKDSSGSDGDDCGWVDTLQWDGSAEPPTPDWETLSYVYACPEPAEWDPAGRRITKKYNGSSVLQRKYVYGPAVDEPICMIEAAGDYAGTYYYHFDALGSVVALTDADANDVQKYDYSVWGQVGADDADHPNPYLFTGRRFDTETGLYYYRARYYHPEIGRFLQTDPIGYGDGMNWYRYCTNNPVNWLDPIGLATVCFYDGQDKGNDRGTIAAGKHFEEAGIDDYFDYSYDMGKHEGYSSSLEYIVAKLDELRDSHVDVTEVYFMDHCNSGVFRFGLEFGDTVVSADREEGFWGDLGATVSATCTINFRQCNVGKSNRRLRNLARWTGRTVTGVEGTIDYWDCEQEGGPDYEFNGSLKTASAGSTRVRVKWSYWTSTVEERQFPVYWDGLFTDVTYGRMVRVRVPNSGQPY